jgi:tetratricopeptide (TPR) repeat protein
MGLISELIEKIGAAQEAQDKLLEGKLYTELGKLYLERNIYHDASRFYQQAAILFEGENQQNHLARSLNHLGICLIMLDHPEGALSHLNRAADIAAENNDLQLRAAIGGNLGLAYNTLGDYTKSIEAHKSVLKTAVDLQNHTLQLNALINLADANLQNKNYQSAQGFALVALDLAETLESLTSKALIYDLLGMITSRQGDLRSAVDYHQQAFLIAESLGDLQRQAIALANQGLALEGLTEHKKAHQVLKQAEEIFQILKSEYVKKIRVDLARINKALT